MYMHKMAQKPMFPCHLKIAYYTKIFIFKKGIMRLVSQHP